MSNLAVGEHSRKLTIVIVSCPERNIFVHKVQASNDFSSCYFLPPQIEKTATHLVLLAVQQFCLFVVESTDVGTSSPSTDIGTYSTDTGTYSTDTGTSTTVAEISIADELL